MEIAPLCCFLLDHATIPFLQRFVGQEDVTMDLDEPQSASVKTYAVKTQSLPELETYFGLLVLEYLVDQKNFGSVCVSCFFFFFFSFIVLKPWSSWTKFHSGHGIVPLLGEKRDFAQQEIP